MHDNFVANLWLQMTFFTCPSSMKNIFCPDNYDLPMIFGKYDNLVINRMQSLECNISLIVCSSNIIHFHHVLECNRMVQEISALGVF